MYCRKSRWSKGEWVVLSCHSQCAYEFFQSDHTTVRRDLSTLARKFPRGCQETAVMALLKKLVKITNVYEKALKIRTVKNYLHFLFELFFITPLCRIKKYVHFENNFWNALKHFFYFNSNTSLIKLIGAKEFWNIKLFGLQQILHCAVHKVTGKHD